MERAEETIVHEEREAPEILKVEQVMDLLQVGRTWVWAHMDEIPHYKIGNVLRFDKARVLEWLRSKEQGG